MKFTMEQDGYTLTFESPADTPDLSAFEVEQRISMVMRRELERFVQIVTVGKKDMLAAAQERQRLRAIDPKTRGPNQIVGVGTKDQDSRIVLDGSEKTGRAKAGKHA